MKQANGRPLRQLNYAQVDVFAERALEGNMLAIFTDARGLSDGEMQALARETNLSETTFILPADDPAEEAEHGVRVRIFTTEEELPFAGHPTLGTAAWLRMSGPEQGWPALRDAAEVRLRLNSGVVPVRFEEPQDGEHGIFGTMRQADPFFGTTYRHEEVARVLGVGSDDLDPSLPVQTVSTGVPFCIVPFRSVAALSRLQSSPAETRAWLAGSDAKFFFCLAALDAAEAERAGADFHTRMQFYSGEDPATGSAAGCAISFLVRHGRVGSGQAAIFRQGVEIDRPSRLHVCASLRAGRVTDVFVGGRTIPVATGRLFLP